MTLLFRGQAGHQNLTLISHSIILIGQTYTKVELLFKKEK
jgi:hypothetical protein